MSDVFPGAPSATVTRLERDAVPAEIVDRLRAGAIVAPADVGTIELEGPGQGAITCFQGLLTSDIELDIAGEQALKAGDRSLAGSLELDGPDVGGRHDRAGAQA